MHTHVRKHKSTRTLHTATGRLPGPGSPCDFSCFFCSGLRFLVGGGPRARVSY